MGKQQHDEIEVVVDLDELIEWGEEEKTEPNGMVPPPPPPGEFEGWDEGEEDLT